MARKSHVVLVILDGWGEAPPSAGNPIIKKNLPFWKIATTLYPHTKLRASGDDVGLTHGQAGNSEAGHLNLGAGRIVDQDAMVISKSIANGTFIKNSAFQGALKHIKKTGGKLHFMGIVSGEKSPHMDPDHLTALFAFARTAGIKKVWFHAFTDGRDSYYKSGITFIRNIEKRFSPIVKIATITGRLYLDRKKHWERTTLAYDAMVRGKGIAVRSASLAVTEAYARGETDEFVLPSVIVDSSGKPQGLISGGDAVIFYNLRSDRARQLAKIFVQKDFEKMNPGAPKREKILKNLYFVAMTDFGPDLSGITTAFSSRNVKNSLPFCLAKKRQLYIAESEKYAHMTYFFNGGYANAVAGEDRKVIQSPSVDSYRETPGMRVSEITDIILKKINKYDFIGVNFASPDMIGHTGDIPAAKKAVKIVDENLTRIQQAVFSLNGTLLITADHGNVEEMLEKSSLRVDTSHSTNLVPFIALAKRFKGKYLKEYTDARLADVATTILNLMEMQIPDEMTGKNLLRF